jgi:hypothetical protein
LIAGSFFFITLFLVSLCGALFALLATNLARSKAEAGLVLLVLLLVQVLFSGGIRPIAEPSSPSGTLASALPVTLALHSLVAAGVQGSDLSASDCSKNNILTICEFPGARRFIQSPGNTGEGGLLTPVPSPPLQPSPPTPSPDDTVETYRGKVESFIAEIEPWSLNLFNYVTILARNNIETENAEDQIRNEFSRFGPAWNARQSSQWIGLLLSAAILLLLFSWTMKVKEG